MTAANRRSYLIHHWVYYAHQSKTVHQSNNGERYGDTNEEIKKLSTPKISKIKIYRMIIHDGNHIFVIADQFVTTFIIADVFKEMTKIGKALFMKYMSGDILEGSVCAPDLVPASSWRPSRGIESATLGDSFMRKYWRCDFKFFCWYRAVSRWTRVL